MGNKKKYLLLFVTALLVAVASLGYYLYNKPAIDIQNAHGQHVLATDLYTTFIEDSSKAKKNYVDKILEVSGMVSLIAENQQQQQVVMLKTIREGAAINCTFEGPAGNIQTGHTVRIRGICKGIGEGDADLGIMGDVYLVRCYVLKNTTNNLLETK